MQQYCCLLEDRSRVKDEIADRLWYSLVCAFQYVIGIATVEADLQTSNHNISVYIAYFSVVSERLCSLDIATLVNDAAGHPIQWALLRKQVLNDINRNCLHDLP